jgi:hypothetical protein
VLNEDIEIVNKTASVLDLQFFQYSDFDLAGTASGDSVLLYPSTSPFRLAYQWDSTIGLSESIVSINPFAGFGAVGFVASIFNSLQDAGITDLGTTSSAIGPGDVEFAFQWDLEIAPFGSKTISKVKDLDINVIPEPSAVALALLGVAVLFGRRAVR